MKNKLFASLTLALFSTLNPELLTFAQGTAFTYQGRLNDGVNPANGIYNLRFALFDAPTVGNQTGSPLTNSPVNVSNGLFAVTLDFGANFPGADRWLEIGVRTNGGGTFFILNPRQQITPAPYAIFAGTVSANGLATGAYASAVTFNNPANSFSGDGTGLTNVNAATLGGLDAANFWVLGGNAVTGGANLGTGDSQPLRLIAGNRRALQLETKFVSIDFFSSWSAVNTLGGASGNVISNGVMGGTITGGGAVTNYLFGSAAAPNTVLDNFSTVGGGLNNTAGYASANLDDARAATVGGGEGNTASNSWATVSGGQRNTSGGQRATVGGGSLNSASGGSATVGGGDGNSASQNWATVGGGHANTSSGPRATVGGGDGNSSVGGDSATVGGGHGNLSSGDSATVAGGRFNTSSGTSATVSGGNINSSTGEWAAVGGGEHNTASYFLTTVGGGERNMASGYTATVPGGDNNLAAGDYSFAAGQQAKANHQGSFVWADSEFADFASTAINQFSIRASGGVQFAPNTSVYFGSQTRQMLNLWGTQYGIGVQSYTVYFRTDNSLPGGGFAWYQGGVHSDAKTNSGGGITMMTLDNSGLRVNGTFVSASDRNVKQNFAEVNSRTVLEKVAQLSIQTWAYKNDPGTKHLGPVAQDFYASFGIGPDDKHISMVDADGVALAAIQGLNQKLEQDTVALRSELNHKDAEIQLLKQRLDALENILVKQK